jgi:hypothetical protein
MKRNKRRKKTTFLLSSSKNTNDSNSSKRLSSIPTKAFARSREEKKNIEKKKYRIRRKRKRRRIVVAVVDEEKMFLVLVSYWRPSSLPRRTWNLHLCLCVVVYRLESSSSSKGSDRALVEEFRWELEHTRKRVRKNYPSSFLSLSLSSCLKTGTRAFDYMLVNKFR